MAGFPDSSWIDSAPGSWVLLALALYGLSTFLLDAVAALRRTRVDRRSVALSILVLIHNQESHIEGVVRSLAARGGPQRLGSGQWELLLVDLDSTDDTPLILQRLARRYGHIRLVNLPLLRRENACEAALFLCRGPMTLLVDLRHSVNAEGLARILSSWE